MNKHLFILISVIFIFFLSACNAIPAVETSAPTASADSTPAATLAPTPTPAQTPEPTPTVDLEAVANAEINQLIQVFLNAEGDYSDEALNEILTSKEPTTAHRANSTDLGLLDSVMVQGIVIDVRQKDDNLLLTFGLKDNDGNRFITSMKLPAYFFNPNYGSTVFVRYIENYAWAPSTDNEFLDNPDNVLTKLESFIGKPLIVFPIANIDEAEWPEDVVFDDEEKELNESIQQAADINKMLYYMIWKNKINPQENLSNVNTNIILPDIKTADDIEKVNLDDIPILAGNFSYF